MESAPADALVRFRLLASAIAGRFVDIAPAGAGEATWTDGATVFVDAAASPKAQLCGITVQAALIGAGSLDESVIRQLRRSSVAARYLAVEGHRALASHDALLPPAVRALVDPASAARTESPVMSLRLATSREQIADLPEAFGAIRPGAVRTPRPDGSASGTGSASAPLARHAQDGQVRELDDDTDSDLDVDLLSSPVGGGGPIGRVLKRMFRDSRAAGSGAPPGQDAVTHATKRSARAERHGISTSSAAPLPDDVLAGGPRAATYPEWDVHRGRYRPDWCTVIETDAAGDGPQPARPAEADALRRPLARLGLGLERCHRQLQGDDIDIDAVVDARVQAAAGSAPDEAVYIESRRRRRDLAVLVLLDASGSAADASATGASVHLHQRSAAAALTVALNDFGDRVALYAFRSRGRSAVELSPLKRFDASLDATVLRRLGAVEPGGYTRLGAAIRHGAAVLDTTAGTPRRLLVVVSDGFAYDHGYEGSYGEGDARRALAEARRRGIGCLCLTIGAGTDPAAMRRVFGTAAHATIPRADDLPRIVGPLFRAALRSAELQRRQSQRRQRSRERLAIDRRIA